jgi:hypothetical protein
MPKVQNVTDSPQSQIQTLTLAARYQAAWAEHTARVAQRQNVLEFYLATAGVIFGYWFLSGKRDDLDVFVAVSVTITTCCASLLMSIHNRVLQHLCNFMKDCERACAVSIRGCGEAKVDLFYFWKDGTDEVDDFHRHQRYFHRAVLALILFATNLFAILETRKASSDLLSGALLVFCIAAPVYMFYGVGRDRRDPNMMFSPRPVSRIKDSEL